MTDYSPTATLARLRALFPRGRFAKQADGMPILTARRKALLGWHIYEHAPDRELGLVYQGQPHGWLERLGPEVIRTLRGAGEGIIYLRWTPEAAKGLRAFSRGRHRPNSTTPPPPQTPSVERRSPANPKGGPD